MLSLEMVLEHLFTAQQWKNRHKLKGMGGGEERERCMNRVTWKPPLSYVR